MGPFTSTGTVTVSALPVQVHSNGTPSEARMKLQRSFATALAAQPERSALPLSFMDIVSILLWLCCTSFVYLMFWRAYASIIAMLGLSFTGVMFILGVVTVVVA